MEQIITCNRCGLEKKISEFYKSSVNRSGHRQPCLRCTEATKKKWKTNNKNKVYESRHKYATNYPEKIRSQKQRRRTAKKGSGGSFTATEWLDLCARYGNHCLCCNEERKLTADHVIPVAMGGTSNIDNIQPLCRSCNSSKGTKTIDYRTTPIVAESR